MKKTIFITAYHPLISRNILAAPFFELLRKGNMFRVVLLVPTAKRSFFEREFGGENVIVESIKRPLNRIDAFLNDLALEAMNTKTISLMRKERKNVWVFSYTHFLFFWAPLVRGIFEKLYILLTPKDAFSALFNRYEPDLIFATDVFSGLDCRLMREARWRKVSIVGMVRSWDNLTTKGLFRVKPDILVVNNPTMKQEAIRFHGITEEKIRVTGIPHYDRYRGEPISSREKFFQKIGVDPSKRLVLYPPLGDRFFNRNTFDRDVIEILSELLPPTHHLLVRYPPLDSVNLEGLKSFGNVAFDRPGEQLHADKQFYKQNELNRRDEDHLIDSLYYSDVLVAVSTTLMVDAAAFDKPVVVIGFDSVDRVSKQGSAANALEYQHIQPLLESGGVRIARSREELREAMRTYLANPSLDEAGRDRIRREQCFKLDGKSSERLFDVLVETMGNQVPESNP